MTKKQQSKVRLVRCPKCTKILPEPEHVPLYTCGGCGTILEAKNYKALRNNTEQVALNKNGVIHACDGRESSGSTSDGVENSWNTQRSETPTSFDNSSLSKESSFFKDKENGEIDDIKSDKNGGANSPDNKGNGEIDDCKSDQTALSEESVCTENKETGDIDRRINQSDSKGGGANAHHTLLENEPWKLIKDNLDDNGQDEECNGIVIENLHQNQIGEVNSETQVESIEYDDEHEEKLVRHVKSAKGVSGHASDHELPDETWKMHIEGIYTHDDRHEQNQIGYLNSAKDASSWTDSTDIENPAENYASDQQQFKEIKISHPVQKHSHKDVSINEINLNSDEAEVEKRGKGYGNETDPNEDASSLTASQLTQLASENPGKHDAFNHEVSKETSKMHLVEVHFQQDMSEKSFNLNADGGEVEKSGKENVNRTYPKDIAEQIGSVQYSSAYSLSTELTHGGHIESLYISAPACATDLKTSYAMGSTKVSEDPLQHQRNSYDNMKGTSKQNSKNVRERDVYVDSEVGTFLIPESSSKRSPAYDGSVSSFDGNDDKVAEQPPKVGERSLSPNNAVAGFDGAEGSPEWNSLPLERENFGSTRAQRPARNSSSMASDEKLKSGMVEEEGPLEGIGIPRRFRPNRENLLPTVSNRRTNETGSTSSYLLHEEAPRHRMHPKGRRFPEAPLWREKEFLPTYYNSETSGEFYERPKHHSYMDRRRRTESWSQSGTLPHMPYSGEMFNGRYPYMHRYPEDRRWSAQLPPPPNYFHQGGYLNPGWETRWDPYDSYPTSPQRFMESESSSAWVHDSVYLSDDQRHKDQIMRRVYLREKRQAVKTPFHPIAGGTPFITCHFCFNILQLPQDFLLSRRRRRWRTHKLKCGACSRVLEFSLHNEGGLTACETNLNRNMNLDMSSHSHVNHSRQSSLNSADGRVLFSNDSFGASNREKRKLGPGSSSNGERMEGLCDDDDAPPARGTAPKVTWQLPARSKSPLHKLMGYYSPNELLTFHEDDEVE